jgi:predicted AAA+ superfamily ATPase
LGDFTTRAAVAGQKEVRQQLGAGSTGAMPYHFRSAAGQEVDIVLEGPGRRLAAIEVKATASLSRGDIVGMQMLAEAAGKKFVRGVVLYLGEQRLPLADQIWAVPVSALWHGVAARVASTRKTARRARVR